MAFYRNFLELIAIISDVVFMISFKILARVAIAVIASVAVLTGCTSAEVTNENGFTPSQQEMSDAGSYNVVGSDHALRACSIIRRLNADVQEGSSALTSPEGASDFASRVFDAQQKSYLAVEQSLRYEAIYLTVSGVDAATLDNNWEAVLVLLEDAVSACQDMTVVDQGFLADRGIMVTPGVIPEVN